MKQTRKYSGIKNRNRKLIYVYLKSDAPSFTFYACFEAKTKK